MDALVWPAFWLATACGVVILLALFWSMAVSDLRIWPPPKGNAGWQFWLVWAFVIVLVAGDLVVAIEDSGSMGLAPTWHATGFMLLILGNLLAWWGVAVLGGWTTTGLAGPIVTAGPYRLSRNPQYLGDVMIAIGIVLASGSALSVWPSALAALCALAAPFAEKPWLRRRLGPAYVAYLHGVPRFFGPL